MIVSGLIGDRWISDGRDWTKPNENACVGFITYRGISLDSPSKLKSVTIKGNNLPNFDLQGSNDLGAWVSLAEVSLKNFASDETLPIPEEMDAFQGYRVLINSRECWSVDALDFELE